MGTHIHSQTLSNLLGIEMNFVFSPRFCSSSPLLKETGRYFQRAPTPKVYGLLAKFTSILGLSTFASTSTLKNSTNIVISTVNLSFQRQKVDQAVAIMLKLEVLEAEGEMTFPGRVRGIDRVPKL